MRVCVDFILRPSWTVKSSLGMVCSWKQEVEGREPQELGKQGGAEGAAERRQEWDHDGGWESSPSTDRPTEQKPSCYAD